MTAELHIELVPVRVSVAPGLPAARAAVIQPAVP